MQTQTGHKVHLGSWLLKAKSWLLRKPGLRGFVSPLGVHTRVDPSDPYFNEHIHHETVHLEQVARLGGWLSFLKLYFTYNWKYGYFNNPLEVEARAEAAYRANKGIPAVK